MNPKDNTSKADVNTYNDSKEQNLRAEGGKYNGKMLNDKPHGFGVRHLLTITDYYLGKWE